MTPKWRKRALWLIIPVFGGPIIGSILATELNGKIGKLNFKHSLAQQLNQFIKTGTKDSNGQNITPVKLVSELAKDPNSVPLLMRGFATQIAKNIFEGKLFKDKHKKQHFQHYLAKINAQTKGSIQQRRKDKTRVKKSWISDEEKYLSALENFVLGKIDFASIDSYYELKEHSWESIKHAGGKVFSFIGFLMSIWIKEFKAGYYVHYLLPYANSFQESTKTLYAEKFKNINLPNKPDFYFPDFDPSKVEEFQEIINLFFGGTNSWLDILGTPEQMLKKKMKEKSAIHWVSSDNTPQTNLALKHISGDSSTTSKGTGENGWKKWASGLWGSLFSMVKPHLQKYHLTSKPCQNGSSTSVSGAKQEISEIKDLSADLKKDPLKLFCISGTENGKTTDVEFLTHSKSKSENGSNKEKIIFYRDNKGFNLLFPSINIDKKETNSESLRESKNRLVDAFKKYVKANFSYLLLKYYIHINKQCNEKNQTHNGLCCCKEIIESLIKLWELSHQLTELNKNLEVWDLRARNNSLFKVADYSQETNYLYKLGTVSANPPEFLKKILEESKIKEVSSSINEHLKKVGDYFNGQAKKPNGVELKEKQHNGTDDHKASKYWSFEEGDKTKKTDPECMKRHVAEFLLEKVSSMDLLKKSLLLPFSFEKIFELTSQKATESGQQSNGTLKKLEESLSQNYKNFFNFESTSSQSGRSKRQAQQIVQPKNNKLIELLLKAIKEELTVSKLSTVSDSFLYKLSSEGSETQKTGTTSNNSDNFETIKSWLTLSNLLNQPLKTANTLERSQLRLLITSMYLMEDSLKEYRELLKSILKNQLFGSYAFSLGWNKFCTQKDDENPIEPKGRVQQAESSPSNGKSSFWAPIDSKTTQSPPSPNNPEWNKEKLDPRSCIKTSDRYSISSIKRNSESDSQAQNNEEIKLMGYKGSLTRGSQLQLPGDLYDKIIHFLLKEGHISWKSILEQIELIKSNRQLYSFIQQLSKIHSSLGEVFKLPDYKNIKDDIDESKRAETLEWFGLSKRKELLKEFIQKYITKGNNSNTLVQTSHGTQPSTSENSQAEKKSFIGLMWDTKSTETADKKQYVFSTKDPNEGSAAVYLIQYNSEDVKDTANFAKFLKEKLTPDALIKDIVKKAQDQGLQSKAINHYLMRGNYAGGEYKVYNLSSDDHYLKDQFSSIIL